MPHGGGFSFRTVGCVTLGHVPSFEEPTVSSRVTFRGTVVLRTFITGHGVHLGVHVRARGNPSGRAGSFEDALEAWEILDDERVFGRSGSEVRSDR